MPCLCMILFLLKSLIIVIRVGGHIDNDMQWRSEDNLEELVLFSHHVGSNMSVSGLVETQPAEPYHWLYMILF